MKLILHIGFNKTGTSAIQKTLSTTSKYLKEKHRILYPETFRDELFRTAHHGLYKLIKDGNLSPKAVRDFRNEVYNSDCETVILSSEEFHNIEGITEFLPLLEDFQEVQVVAYVRDSLTYLLSWWQQNIQSKGSHLRFDDWVYLIKYAPLRNLKVFAKSPKNIKTELSVKRYSRKDLYLQDSVFDFLKTIYKSSITEDKEFISLKPKGSASQNLSICGNVLYLRILHSATYGRSSAEIYNLFTDLSKLKPNCFNGVTWIDAEAYSSTIEGLKKIDNRLNNIYNINLSSQPLDYNKRFPNLEEINEDFDLFASYINDNECYKKYYKELAPLLKIKFN